MSENSAEHTDIEQGKKKMELFLLNLVANVAGI